MRAQVLSLPAPLAVGLILVSCCPGGQVMLPARVVLVVPARRPSPFRLGNELMACYLRDPLAVCHPGCVPCWFVYGELFQGPVGWDGPLCLSANLVWIQCLTRFTAADQQVDMWRHTYIHLMHGACIAAGGEGEHVRELCSQARLWSCRPAWRRTSRTVAGRRRC